MSINFTTTVDSERFAVGLPEASAIPVPAVAKAARDAHEAYGRLNAQRRSLQAAFVGVETAERLVKNQAAELAIKKKDLPKDIRKTIKDAEEALAVAQLEHGATETAFRHAYQALVSEVTANRKALEAAALTVAEQSLQRMAAAREAFASASHDAYAGYGLLGMFTDNDQRGMLTLKYRDPKGSKRGYYVTEALEAMGQAVGHSNLELAAYKRGEAPTRREREAADDGEE
jgi:hypothetical protein